MFCEDRVLWVPLWKILHTFVFASAFLFALTKFSIGNYRWKCANKSLSTENFTIKRFYFEDSFWVLTATFCINNSVCVFCMWFVGVMIVRNVNNRFVNDYIIVHKNKGTNKSNFERLILLVLYAINIIYWIWYYNPWKLSEYQLIFFFVNFSAICHQCNCSSKHCELILYIFKFILLIITRQI